MDEIKNQGEPTFTAKRKPALSCGEQADYPNKTQKLQVPDNSSSLAEEGKTENPENLDNNSSFAEEKSDKFEANADPEEEGDEEDYEEDDEEDDDQDEDSEKSNGKAEVDRKGKGIMRDDKGKGKLIEEDEDDSDDDSSDGGSEFEEDDGDLSDDPLAEVDLDNILPSRTRRRQVQPGVYIANDIGNNDEEDDSDDSDAQS